MCLVGRALLNQSINLGFVSALNTLYVYSFVSCCALSVRHGHNPVCRSETVSCVLDADMIFTPVTLSRL